jgi:polysaccharide biosynthesis PFTS motif protein
MFRKLIRKKHFRTLLAQLRGAKKLRDRGTPFFVANTVSSLTEVHIGLKESDFPKILVGSHGPVTEILLRQILLQYYGKICSAVMQSTGGDKPLSIPLPSAWRKHLNDNGISCSDFNSRVLLFFSALRQIMVGFAKSLILLSPFNKPKSPDCPYVVFPDLLQSYLPASKNEKSYDLISWYKDSKIRKTNIGKIWAQAKVAKDYKAPQDLIVTPSLFPKLASFAGYARYFYRNICALFVAIFGVLTGKWWYGYMYHENIYFNYFRSLKTDQLADHYFFGTATWFYKPLWAHEAERKGLTLSLYCWSINMDKTWYDEHKEPDTYGCKTITWNHFIVWDKQQEDFFKRYRPQASYTRVGYVNHTGSAFNHTQQKGIKLLSVFDITPMRPILYTSHGFAIAPYSEEMILGFLEDIIKVCNDETWQILWKPKRVVGSSFISNAFQQKRKNLIENHMISLKPTIAAVSLVEASDAVITLPFSSPSLIAKVKGIPSVYYDSSGQVKKKESHGLPVLKNRVELKEWFESLPANYNVDIRG